MSEYVLVQNRLKMAAAHGSLTPSQARCYCLLQQRLRDPGIVALYGRAGTGKTYLAWSLAACGAVYVPLPERLPESCSDTAIYLVDNCPNGRDGLRDLLRRLALAGVRRAVLLMRAIPGDDMSAMHLTFEDADASAASAVLDSIGMPANDATAQSTDLRGMVRRRGGSHD